MLQEIPKLSETDKAKFGPILNATWESIGPDAGPLLSDHCRVAGIIELVCDAGRPMQFGMTAQDYERLVAAYNNEDTQKWLRTILNY